MHCHLTTGNQPKQVALDAKPFAHFATHIAEQWIWSVLCLQFVTLLLEQGLYEFLA